MNKEEFFIKQFSNNKIIGDDGAFIDGFVYSMDAFFENVHFKKEWMSLKQIAYKSMKAPSSPIILLFENCFIKNSSLFILYYIKDKIIYALFSIFLII
jgi:spore cortex formation protein SpoVR/YcgB (stage V sporulation)